MAGNPTKPLFEDTSPEAERVLLEGFRRMTGAKKLEQVCALNDLVRRLAIAGLRSRRPAATREDQEVYLASLWLERDLFNKCMERLGRRGRW